MSAVTRSAAGSPCSRARSTSSPTRDRPPGTCCTGCISPTQQAGRCTLAGYKDVRPGPLTAVWPETSTLYARILNGHVPVPDGGSGTTEGLAGSGILKIPPADFAWQLTTFRVHGPTLAGRIRALDSFGELFLSELWQVFGPARRLARKAALASKTTLARKAEKERGPS